MKVKVRPFKINVGGKLVEISEGEILTTTHVIKFPLGNGHETYLELDDDAIVEYDLEREEE